MLWFYIQNFYTETDTSSVCSARLRFLHVRLLSFLCTMSNALVYNNKAEVGVMDWIEPEGRKEGGVRCPNRLHHSTAPFSPFLPFRLSSHPLPCL
jgi:hypothetical protein